MSTHTLSHFNHYGNTSYFTRVAVKCKMHSYSCGFLGDCQEVAMVFKVASVGSLVVAFLVVVQVLLGTSC